jgi:hypothetical protein
MREITFTLVCNCGQGIDGFMYEDDHSEQITCHECKLVWVVPRPHREEDEV